MLLEKMDLIVYEGLLVTETTLEHPKRSPIKAVGDQNSVGSSKAVTNKGCWRPKFVGPSKMVAYDGKLYPSWEFMGMIRQMIMKNQKDPTPPAVPPS